MVALEAWLRWFTVHPQGSSLRFLTHTLPFPGAPSSHSLDSALPRPWLEKSGRNQGGLPRILEACLEPMERSTHLGTAPRSNIFSNSFYPSEDGKRLQ